jgi:hypothetical protein
MLSLEERRQPAYTANPTVRLQATGGSGRLGYPAEEVGFRPMVREEGRGTLLPHVPR